MKTPELIEITSDEQILVDGEPFPFYVLDEPIEVDGDANSLFKVRLTLVANEVRIGQLVRVSGAKVIDKR